ncbi:MAG: DUF1553 domain-containing protein [Armatimonadota bacterium]
MLPGKRIVDDHSGDIDHVLRCIAPLHPSRRTARAVAAGWLAIGCLLAATRVGHAADDAGYVRTVKPILRERCFACHGALKQEAKLRLDTAVFVRKGGRSGPAVRPGNPAASLLLTRVAAPADAGRMPPLHEGEPLTRAQIESLQRWIAAGANAPSDERPEADPRKHWAFQPIRRPAVPRLGPGWGRNPIEAFLRVRHQANRIKPQPEAPRIVLLRRLHLDLIGIPPTLEEIAACEADRSPQWAERTAKHLLDDPRHGERWARHWMDIWRYSDWWGLGDQLRNSQKHIWHWRDWIVESLNADTPYDEMVRLMLAADETHPGDLGKLRATGYLARNYWLFNRPQWMEETVEHVGKGFLGLTVNCARCHDHKYDPVKQTDYYRLRAFFEPYHVRMDAVPGEADLARDGIPRAFDGLLEEPTYLYVRGDERNPDKSRRIGPGVPEFLTARPIPVTPVALPEDAWQPERRAWVLETHIASATARLAAAEADRTTAVDPADAAGAELAVASARAELEAVRCRAVATRSAAGAREPVESAVRAERQARVAEARRRVAVAELAMRRAPANQKEATEKTLKADRDALEAAIAAASAPVKPTDTFTRFVGAAWTPTRFLDSGKDDPLVPFPPRSSGRRTALANWITDRRNPLAARVAVNHIWTRHMGQPLVPTVFDFGRKGTPPTHPELLDWLASELIDSGWSMKHIHTLIVGSAAYRMSSSVAGADAVAAKDPDNRLWWRRTPIRLESQLVRDALLAMSGTLDATRGGPPVPVAEQAESTRRSLYFFHSNNERNLFLTLFDEALVKDCYRREQSVVPQQALALTNSALAQGAAERIARRLGQGAVDDAGFVRNAFLLVTGIHAGAAEQTASLRALEAWKRLPGGSPATARIHFVWALINHNDFVTLR